MPLFVKKPVTIQAMQYTGDPMDTRDILQWVHHGLSPYANSIIVNHGSHLTVRTLEGIMNAAPGDWIIRGVNGEFYPCKPDIFKATYDEIPATVPTDSLSAQQTKGRYDL